MIEKYSGFLIAAMLSILNVSCGGGGSGIAANGTGGSTGSTGNGNSTNPVATAPSAPLSVTAASGNAGAVVSFQIPSSSGSSAISGYVVVSSPLGGIDQNSGSAALTHAISNLVNGTAYTFTVTASNAAGFGPASAPSNSVTPITTATAPTNVTATAGNASAVVTFAAPASNGGSAITGYYVSSNPAGGVDTNAGSPSLSHTIASLVNGTSYVFTVTANNSAGLSVPSIASSPVTPTNQVSSTALISAYMSSTYAADQAALANQIGASANAAAAGSGVCSGAFLMQLASLKETETQSYLNSVYTYISNLSSTSQISSSAIDSLLSTYQAQDSAWFTSSQIPNCAYSAVAISSTGFSSSINSMYSTAIQKINSLP